MYQIDTKVISNKKISKDFFLLTFSDKQISESTKPGQFIMIKIDNDEIFLRRPFSICGINSDRFDVLFKVVGRGTEFLSCSKPGDVFNIIGPLGNGFPLPSTPYSLPPVLIAGGTGIASILLLSQFLKASNMKCNVFLGAKTKKEIMLEKNLKKCGGNVVISTEDGSYGKEGLITDIFALHLSSAICPLRSRLSEASHLSSVVYACGPRPMLEKVSKICNKYNLKCFVSLEEKMGCGIGTCMGCAVKVIAHRSSVIGHKFEYRRVCKDGPVFDAKEIVW
ncbi:MAG: dihydroorotate dehydrogenase electron transfer subunit [Elusimicrobia bacterium]|nr:dihydroorotate dehydrogenase electron transfer subunit [Elusimicrobiota bacterium]